MQESHRTQTQPNRLGLIITIVAFNVIVSALAIMLPFTNLAMFQTTSTTTAFQPRAADSTLTLPLNGPTTSSAMVVTTNFYNATEIDPATTPQAGATAGWLQQWSPPLVRLHMGFTGTPVSLPESQEGVWDFTTLDNAIQRLRANHITFFLNVRNGPPWMFDSQGNLRDSSYQEFATYMAQLVGWYNKGGFTDGNGVYHKSGHIGWIHAWEIWNEPNSGFEIPAPVADPAATWMDATTFARLYSVVSTAMHQVDPTIITGGPALSAYPDDQYLRDFITNVTAPLDFLSFHFYAIGDQKAPDPVAFEQITSNFQHRLVLVRNLLDQTFPGKHVPIWVDEVGYNEIARLPLDPRGAAPVGISWMAATFAQAEYQHIAMFAEFAFLGSVQLGMIDARTNRPLMPYWLLSVLSREFPVGALVLPVQTPTGSGMVALAAVAPDGRSVRVVIANTLVAHATDINGKGVAREVQIDLTGNFQGHGVPAPGEATAWTFDARTSSATGPAPRTLKIFRATNGAPAVQDLLSGYGVDVIQIPLR
jgi:hypothetical protein